MLVSASKIKAVDLFASKEEVRYYLNGVFFELEGGKLNLVATDGHRLLICTEARKEWKKLKDQKFIIPSELIKKIKLVRGFDDLELTTDGTKIKIEYANDCFSGEMIDGTFPDYRRVIPDYSTLELDGEKRRKKMTKEQISNEVRDYFEIGFNPKYLADFAKVNDLLGYKNEGIKIVCKDKSSPTLIYKANDRENLYTGVLMPLRVA